MPAPPKQLSDEGAIFLRHGPTQFNSEGRQFSSQERVRGWSDPPLSEEGEQVAQEAAETLSQYPIERITSSDFQRAAHTAQIVGDRLGVPVETTDQLRSWNLGDFSGKPLKDVEQFIDKLTANPDQPAPSGESLADFLNRSIPIMDELVHKPGLDLVVTHGRLIKAIQAYYDSGGDTIDLDKLKEEEWPEPGEAVYVQPNGQWISLTTAASGEGKGGDRGAGHA